MIILALLVLLVLGLIWKLGPRRPSEPGFKFVYVNQDGSVRELSPAEQAYLSEEFAGWDSSRPYIKSTYRSRDGWGSRSGFIARRYVPARIEILPVHPDYDAREKELGFDPFAAERAAGEIIVTQTDGAVNPKISRRARFKVIRSWHLEDQRRREKLASMRGDARSDANRS